MLDGVSTIMTLQTNLFGLQNGDGDLIPLSGVDETLKVSMSSFVRDPAGLLGIIRLCLELDLELWRDVEPLVRAGIRAITLLKVARHDCYSLKER